MTTQDIGITTETGVHTATTSDPATTDFAAFERLANAEPVESVDPVDPISSIPDEDDKGGDQAKEGEQADGDAAKDSDGQPKKRRSKPASERIAELTARLREAERALEAKNQPESGQPKEPSRPDPSDFEFGEGDPEYIDKLTDYKLELRDAEKAKTSQQQQQHQGMIEHINAGLALAEETAKTKYDDFDARIAEAVTARAGAPMPPMLTVGIGLSPVGGDILYRIATDEAISERLEDLANGGAPSAKAMAMALGEVEGEYLDDDSDSDLDTSDEMDMARMMGRMRTRMRREKAAPPKQPFVSVTSAPAPPKERMRGGGGQFGTDPATTDFAAFERMVAQQAKSR